MSRNPRSGSSPTGYTKKKAQDTFSMQGSPWDHAEARVGRRGVLEEVTLKDPGGLKQHGIYLQMKSIV